MVEETGNHEVFEHREAEARGDVDVDVELTVIDPSHDVVSSNDALPRIINVIPQEQRPFFPGQVIPLVMNADIWLPTFKVIQESGQQIVGVVATKVAPGKDTVSTDELYQFGTVCRIHRIHREGQELQVLLEGLARFKVNRWVNEQPIAAEAVYVPRPSVVVTDELKGYAVAVINTIKELIPLNPLYGEELKVFLDRSNLNEPSLLADFAAGLTTASKEELQGVLETIELMPRLEKVLKLLHQEVRVARTQTEIRQHVETTIQEHQREALLREQLKFIQQELGLSKDDKTAEIEKFEERIEALSLPAAAEERINDELGKLRVLELGSPEYGVTRNYLDWLTALPWGVVSEDSDDLARASTILDSHHEGLEDIKDRIKEFLALGIMKGDVAGSIILFVGPPGVGKTSLGKAIAEALSRKFYRFSVGGMRDEAEIKGHRRTYIGAMPGKLVQALKDTGVSNPVVMLDEVDKIGASYQGDPASALLEVLDPEQNDKFHDHYLDVDFDLSNVLFICTANQLDTIPGPLLDRMEVIQLSGYLAEEKLRIARNHLIPRQLERAGLASRGDLRFDTAALRKIIDGYARESGVRRLEKNIGAVVRKSVVRLLDGEEKPIRIRARDVETMLGRPLYTKERRERGVGVITGLAYTAAGGATLPVEAVAIEGTKGFKTTGQLGDVMVESASIAMSFVLANADRFGIDPAFFEKHSVHVHVPAGATPKDGPSAGITIASALVSLARNERPGIDAAMTGELTLTGSVYPIGGVREKLLAAKRQNIRKVLIPADNERDLDEVPDGVRDGMEIHLVKHFDEVAALLFGI